MRREGNDAGTSFAEKGDDFIAGLVQSIVKPSMPTLRFSLFRFVAFGQKCCEVGWANKALASNMEDSQSLAPPTPELGPGGVAFIDIP